MNTKFIVLTTNRSGSVWVMSTLNSLNGVTTQGELFLPRKRVAEKRWDSEFARPRYIETKAGLGLRPFSVFSYLDSLYNDAPGIFGFKLMYAQLGAYPEILPYLIWHSVRVVHLVRRNHLDVLISYAVKARLGQAHLLQGQSAPEDMRVELDGEKLIKRMEWLERKQNLARAMLRGCRLPHFEVAYEDLYRNRNEFRQICDFLSVNSEEALPESTLVKIRKGGHRDVIKNYSEVKERLYGSRFATLLD